MLRRIIAVDGKQYKIVIFIPYKKTSNEGQFFMIILE
jgi:hypothetical protein